MEQLVLTTRTFPPVISLRASHYPEGCVCDQCQALRVTYELTRPTQEAIARAENLLRRFTTASQYAQWERDQQLAVRGSDGQRYMLTPRHSPDHSAVAREDGLGISVWPQRLAIAADWALAMKFYLEADAPVVVRSGCHAAVLKPKFPGSFLAGLPLRRWV